MSKRVFRSSRGKYVKKTFLGYTLPKAREFRSPEAFLNEFISLNKAQLKERYVEDLETAKNYGAEANFRKTYPSLEKYVKSRFSERSLQLASREKSGFSITKLVKEQIETVFASISVRQANHIWNLIKSDYDFYEEFLFRINEKVDPNRLEYTKDNTYRYTTRRGKIIRFKFRKYSPSILEFFDESNDEEK